MAYMKNAWSETTPITADKLNNLETQYEQAKLDVDAHANADAPHKGHATKSELNSHKTDTFAHDGVLAKQKDLDSHIASPAPHAGHTTDAEFSSHINSSDPHPNLPTKAYVDAHINASAPHKGHATTGQVNTVANDLNSHKSSSSPHSDHVKGSMRITVSSFQPSNPANNDIWIVI